MTLNRVATLALPKPPPAFTACAPARLRPKCRPDYSRALQRSFWPLLTLRTDLAPTTADKLIYGGQRWDIKEVRSVAPAETVMLYKLGVTAAGSAA